jgi:hypothetical protein
MGGGLLSPENGGRALGMGAEVRVRRRRKGRETLVMGASTRHDYKGGKGRAGGCLYDWGKSGQVGMAGEKKGRTGRERAEAGPVGEKGRSEYV